ncbi:MAG: molybdopterin molybdotransferase MoeA [Candidatus Omnitrophica bacterium]|nr:molybdopterin molybdotransferase MoeA [Candidatus Omnitrophota bacterium]
MIEFERALQEVLNRARRLGIESLSLKEAVGSVLAEDVKSKFDIPSFHKSAMDGYALCAKNLESAPVDLRAVGTVPAGGFYPGKVKKGECVKIMTGSPLPEGTDSVIMIEFTKDKREPGWVRILRRVSKGENVCLQGEDIEKGKIVLKKGTLIRVPEVAVLAILGRAKIKVYKRPKVSILCTGDELIEPGYRLKSSHIYNSNGPMICSLLTSMNIENQYLGIAKDEAKDLKKEIEKGLRDNLFILSGGVSMGDYDLVPKVLRSCGVKAIFHKVSIKPGKPILFGLRGRTLIFGVPGNPVSTYLTFLILIKPAIEEMMGKEISLKIEKGILKTDFRQKPGKRKHFLPVYVKMKEKQGEVFPVKSYHGSADIASLLPANGFMMVDADVSFLKKNSKVDIILW